MRVKSSRGATLSFFLHIIIISRSFVLLISFASSTIESKRVVQVRMRSRNIIATALLSSAAAAASCGSTTITSQSDADALAKACPTVTGDVILATNAAGLIDLDGIEAIVGSLASDKSPFTSLSSSTLVSVSQNISLQGLTALINISLPQLTTVGAQFYLDSLPALLNLTTPLLSSVGQFHLVAAPELVSMNLTQLRNVTGRDASIEVTGVGLSSLDSLNVKTNLSSFIFRNNSAVLNFAPTSPQIDYLEIAGSYYLDTGTEVDLSSTVHVGTLNMTGCTAFGAADTATYDNAIFSQNMMEDLTLTSVKVTNKLSIVNNGNMQIFLPNNMSIPNIELRGIEGFYDLIGPENSWPWAIKNISTMILEGVFTPDFFLSDNFTLVEVSNEFTLNAVDPTFDCSYLNSLRKQGYFQGNYSCQGKTLKAGHVRTSAEPDSGSSALSTSLLSVVAGLAIAMILAAV